MSEENKQPEAAKAQEMPKEHKFLVGEKLGMTQVFGEDGTLKGVTVIKAGPCKVAYTRTAEKDGYSAVCLGFGEKKEKNATRQEKKLAAKLAVSPLRHLREFRVENLSGAEAGQVAGVERFVAGDYVDLQGISKGKGFAGGMKRHNFKGQPASHGACDRERAPGSLGSRRSLGRVMPGQRMAGHLGNEKVSVQKMKVIKVIPEENLILINGGVPGPVGSIVCIRNTNKRIPKPSASQPKKKGAKTDKKKK
ncbi:MAG: 50S ribosomal protein L3 [Elusimicrobiales bacterium]|nr:50S ribosomal protein L3 [Elusimicrobiales bacterium]